MGISAREHNAMTLYTYRIAGSTRGNHVSMGGRGRSIYKEEGGRGEDSG